MSIDDQVIREEERLSELYASGEISLEQYNREMRNLHREAAEEARAEAEEAAERAYHDVLGDF